MTYRRKADSRSLRFLFVLVLLVLGILLPLASALLSPASTSNAAAALPTAQVYRPTLAPEVVALTQPLANDQRLTASDQPAAVAASQPSPVATAVDRQPPAVGEAPPAVPTLTSTAVPLAPLDAGAAAAPIATLFPTAPPQAAAEEDAAQTAPAASGGVPPILMYHYIRAVDEGSDAMGYNLSVRPDDFDRQMAWMHEQGYAGVRMDAVTRCLNGEAPCPAKVVALTFDDGYADAFTDALPVLKHYGFSATFYIVSNFIGQPGYMTWEQVAALRDAGMEIGAHTIDHLDLRTLDPNEMLRQIAQSKDDLEARLAIHVTSFCYPAGFYDPAIEEMVRASGYLNATTTRWDGDYSDMLALPRRRVAGGTPLDGFAAIVQG